MTDRSKTPTPRTYEAAGGLLPCSHLEEKLMVCSIKLERELQAANARVDCGGKCNDMCETVGNPCRRHANAWLNQAITETHKLFTQLSEAKAEIERSQAVSAETIFTLSADDKRLREELEKARTEIANLHLKLQSEESPRMDAYRQRDECIKELEETEAELKRLKQR